MTRLTNNNILWRNSTEDSLAAVFHYSIEEARLMDGKLELFVTHKDSIPMWGRADAGEFLDGSTKSWFKDYQVTGSLKSLVLILCKKSDESLMEVTVTDHLLEGKLIGMAIDHHQCWLTEEEFKKKFEIIRIL